MAGAVLSVHITVCKVLTAAAMLCDNYDQTCTGWQHKMRLPLGCSFAVALQPSNWLLYLCVSTGVFLAIPPLLTHGSWVTVRVAPLPTPYFKNHVPQWRDQPSRTHVHSITLHGLLV